MRELDIEYALYFEMLSRSDEIDPIELASVLAELSVILSERLTALRPRGPYAQQCLELSKLIRNYRLVEHIDDQYVKMLGTDILAYIIIMICRINAEPVNRNN